MKKSLLLTVLVCCSLAAIAQNRKIAGTTPKNVVEARKFLAKLLSKQYEAARPSEKTTVTRERLIGMSDYVVTSIADSFRQNYSNGRGSKYHYDLEFSLALGPDYTNVGNDLFGYDISVGIPFPKNEAPLALSDTVLQFSSSITPGVLSPFGIEVKKYDVYNNCIDAAFIGAPGLMWQRNVSTYNSNQDIIKVIQFSENSVSGGLPWDTVRCAVFTYNTSHQMTIDSEFVYDYGIHSWGPPEKKYTYNYDLSGDMVLAKAWVWNSGAWLLEGTYYMTYYAGTHQLKTFDYETNGTLPLPYIKDSLGYTTGVSYFTYCKQQQFTSGILNDVTILVRNVNSLLLPDTTYVYDYGNGTSIISKALKVTTYNSFRDPIAVTDYFDNTVVVPTVSDWIRHYYYEPYNAVSVPESGFYAKEVKVFPNPANGSLSITIPDFSKAEKLYVEFLNVAGQSVLKDMRNWQNATETFSVGALAPGDYFVTIRDTEGLVLYKGNVVKL